MRVRTAQIHLDKRLRRLRPIDELQRPPRGWVKAIRDALGMTTQQMAKRMGVSQPRVIEIERAEVRGALTLASLERAAAALDCTLVYALVPRKTLEQLVEERAKFIATQQLARIDHTMRLEDQAVDQDVLAEELGRRVAELSDNPRRLWDM